MARLILFILLALQSNIEACLALNIEKKTSNIFFSNTKFHSNAPFALLFDHDTQTVLFSKNGHLKMVPSSMSKLMTLYIAFHQLRHGAIKLDDKFNVSEKAWKMGGTKTFLQFNTPVTVEDLLRGAIVQSGNDASVALAEGIAGDEESFVNYMNQAAAELNLKDSVFANSTGWPHENHRMSAKDLAYLASALINHFPEYYHYFGEQTFTYNSIAQNNRNDLLGKEGVDGLKTGRTDDGGYGVVVSALQNGIRLIAVVNGLKNDKERSTEAQRLLTYGFKHFTAHTLKKAGEIIAQPEVMNGHTQYVEVVNHEAIKIMLPLHVKPDSLTTSVEYHEPIVAPITKGQKLGILHVKNGDSVIKEVPLYALTDIRAAAKFVKLWRKLKTNLGI